MKSLATLIKLQKSNVDEQRQLLAKLQARLDAIRAEIAEHEALQERERQAVRKNPEAGLTYGAFVKWALAHAKELDQMFVTAAKAVEIARDKLAELFEEQKRYELAEAERIEEERREELRQETILLDEVGSVSYERRKRREKGR